VITLFLIIGLFGSDVFAAKRYPLLNQPVTTIASPPVILQSGSVGNSTIYANNTSAMVNVAAPEYQYVTITINNSQTSPTPNPFQEKITWNPSSYTSYEASDLGNIRFYSDNALTTPLYAWLESSPNNTATSATAWVKLTSPIAANGGTLTIYMAFLSTSTHFDGNYWGDAPNLSPTYGQYDNGVNVFSFYDNFNGTSLSSKWTSIISSSGASVAVNNGLTVTTTSTTGYAFVISATQPYPAVAETYTSSGNSILGVATTKSVNTFIAPYSGYSMDWYAGSDDLEYEAPGGPTHLTSISQSTFPTGVWQVTWSANASEYFADGAGNTYTGTYSGVAIANYSIYVGQSNGVIASSVFRWARMRAYPPSNVMPSFSFGNVPFYVLNVVNQVTNAWNVSLQVYGSSNIARLSNATIGFHDGTSSNQIVVNGGSIVQSQGALYNLLGGSGTTIHVSMSNLLANTTGASYLYVYLEILTPNTSTFLLYAITFAIT
jgi:hypothetical protein